MTNPIAPYAKLDNTSMFGTTYKNDIDNNSVAALRIVGKFLPHAQTSPNMTVAVDAGHIFDGETLSEIAAQNTATITAPVAHPRIDRIVVDNLSGAISVVSGSEATSPVAPTIPSGKSPIAQITLTTSTTSITNTIITDERDFTALNVGGFGSQTIIASSSTCDLGTAQSHNAIVTGTTTITGFGSSASTLQPIYLIEFSGILTLTYDATAMVLPGAANIITAAGDTAIAEYLGSGNWRIRSYQRVSGLPLVGFSVTVSDVPNGFVVDRAYAEYTGHTQFTGTIPFDNTVPQVSEGSQILSVSITPKSTTNTLRVTFSGWYMSSLNATEAIAAAFVNGGSNAVAASCCRVSSNDSASLSMLVFEFVPGSTSSQTITIRIGDDGGRDITFNGYEGSGMLGGSGRTVLVVDEIKS